MYASSNQRLRVKHLSFLPSVDHEQDFQIAFAAFFFSFDGALVVHATRLSRLSYECFGIHTVLLSLIQSYVCLLSPKHRHNNGGDPDYPTTDGEPPLR